MAEAISRRRKYQLKFSLYRWRKNAEICQTVSHIKFLRSEIKLQRDSHENRLEILEKHRSYIEKIMTNLIQERRDCGRKFQYKVKPLLSKYGKYVMKYRRLAVLHAFTYWKLKGASFALQRCEKTRKHGKHLALQNLAKQILSVCNRLTLSRSSAFLQWCRVTQAESGSDYRNRLFRMRDAVFQHREHVEKGLVNFVRKRIEGRMERQMPQLSTSEHIYGSVHGNNQYSSLSFSSPSPAHLRLRSREHKYESWVLCIMCLSLKFKAFGDYVLSLSLSLRFLFFTFLTFATIPYDYSSMSMSTVWVLVLKA